jgi:hypothetical protein
MAIIIPALPYTLTNGTTADANQVMADFSDIVTGVNTNGAHNGPNSDITSLTGLTTPLSIGQGGTGVGAVGAAGTIPVSDGSAFAWSNTVNGPLTVTGAVNLNGKPNNITGVTDNSNAAAGMVGEYLTASGGPFAVATGAVYTGINLSLSAGDWDVWGFAAIASGSNCSIFMATISTTSGALGIGTQLVFTSAILGPGSVILAALQRISLGAPAPVYLGTRNDYASGSVSINGTIYARRVR